MGKLVIGGVAGGASAAAKAKRENTELEGVYTLRSMEDGERLLKALPGARRAAILGAGYIGLEVAEAFRKRGPEVTLLEAKDRPLPHWDTEVGDLLREELERHGVEVWTGVRVEALRGMGRVEAVETSEGVVPADLVLVATGVRPNTGLAQAMGVALGPTGAIATDERMRTNLEGVYAAGDVAESFHQVLKRPYWLPLGDVANTGAPQEASSPARRPALGAWWARPSSRPLTWRWPPPGFPWRWPKGKVSRRGRSSSKAGMGPTTTREARPFGWNWCTRRAAAGFWAGRWWPMATGRCASMPWPPSCTGEAPWGISWTWPTLPSTARSGIPSSSPPSRRARVQAVYLCPRNTDPPCEALGVTHYTA